MPPHPAGLLLAAILLAVAAAVTPTPYLPPYKLYNTSSLGTEFGFVSPRGLHRKGLPRLIIALGSSIETTLGPTGKGTPDLYYYSNACPWLVRAGWACASLDLPSHGKQVLPGEPDGIAGWRWRTDKGIDFVAESQRRIEDMVQYIQEQNLANATGVAIAGISRGGFLAAQYAGAWLSL